MGPPRRLVFSLNPNLYAYAATAALVSALFFGLVRYVVLDRSDPLRCEALVSKGRWLDSGFHNWQPDGCMTHPYTTRDAETCFGTRGAIFIGDSVTRKLFQEFAHLVDPLLPNSAPSDNEKHVDHYLQTSFGMDIHYFWDPFFNTSNADSILSNALTVGSQRPSLLVIGAGVWYLRYSDTSGGLPAWEAKMEALLDAITHASPRLADQIVILPVEDLVTSKLSPERAATMLASDRDAMNSDLYHRIHPATSGYSDYFSTSKPTLPVTLPTVFNAMLDPSQTDDGLHYSEAVVRAQANVLLNARCNEQLPKTFPLNKTCCRQYPQPSVLHFIVLTVMVLWGPYTFMLSRRYGPKPANPFSISKDELPSLVISGAIALVYLADRTGFWLKEQKQFDSWTYAILNLLCLAIGLGTVKRADKDLGFLNRDQTDEWKGWMQIAILLYHYFGASKVAGIYNPIRVLVASYIFLTGYGHTTYYLKKADFRFWRVAQIIVRLNLFTLFLAYAMNTDYLSYYFAPLVTMWYLIIYGTMSIGSQFNDRTPFLLAKLVVSMVLVTWFMAQLSFLEGLFDLLDRFCGIRWSAKEWAFRVNLDLWIVYIGMLAAIVALKLHKYRLTEHLQWSLAAKVATAVSGFVLLWFFSFELTQPSKFAYNVWHPYVSFLPVLAFIVLRNANAVLRSASSRAFAFIGKCSLETFVIQYHLWLAADTTGVLIVIPWTRWRLANMLVTGAMFVFVSHHVAQATGAITAWVCGTDNAPKELPTTSVAVIQSPAPFHDRDVSSQPSREEAEGKPEHVDVELEPIPLPQRWVDRLVDGSSGPATSGFRVWYGDTEWKPGVGMKLTMGIGLMWVLNILW